jgi:peptide/nickel transport system substrate-binding protein
MSDQLKHLEKLLIQGKITRREFLAHVSALGLMAAVSSACSRAKPVLLPPREGGVLPEGGLRLGSAGNSTTDSLDAGTLSHTMPMICNQSLRSNLVEIDHKDNPIPELAESWEPTPNAKKWIFKLRKGVEFHDGKTMDAEDVLFSINHHRKKRSKSAAWGYLLPITDIKADGKHTVVFTLKEGNADFPVTMSDYHIPIVPAGTKGAEWEKGMGTGPFILQAWKPGVRFFAKRNPNYFKEGRPHFDAVEILGIADTNARTNALKTGQIHVMNRCEPKTLHLLERARGVQVLKLEGARHYTIPMLTTMKPYDNNDVRLGLKYAIDRQLLVDKVLHWYGYLGNDHPIPRNNKYFAKELPQREYDPDKAKFHLRKAGFLDHEFKLHAADAAYPGAIDASVLIQKSAAKAGIKIRVVREPNDEYWKKVWGKKEWVQCYWSGRPTADWMFSLAYTVDANWNDTKWNHPKFNQLLNVARTEIDQKKRREMYVELQRICRDEGATPIWGFAKQLSAATEKLDHGPVAANWEFDGLRLPERWWFKS